MSRLRSGRYGWISLSLAAFIISLSVALTNAYVALRGPRIEVTQPKTVILYRDGNGARSVLGVAIRIDAINASANYSDVLTEAWLTPTAGGPSFEADGTVDAVFTPNVRELAKSCPMGARCIPEDHLLLIQHPDSLVELPPGSARAINLSIPITFSNCSRSSGCPDYRTADQVIKVIAKGALNLRLNLLFHSDGRRTVLCHGVKLDEAFFQRVGFVSMNCSREKTSDSLL